MEQDMRDLIILGTVAVVLHQNTEIIQDPQILVDDVLLSGCRCPLAARICSFFGDSQLPSA